MGPFSGPVVGPTAIPRRSESSSMPRMLSLLPGIVTVTVLGVASPANAATITFDNIVATWWDVQGGTSVSFSGNGTGSAMVTWGTATEGSQSGYSFTSMPGPMSVVLQPGTESDLAIGTFTHFNQPIVGTSITGVRLTISGDVRLDGNPLGNYLFVHDFVHFETPNGGALCADGGSNHEGVNVNGCADSVSLNHDIVSNSFQIGSDLYTVDIRSFELIDTAKAPSFWTTEGAASEAFVIARVSLSREATSENIEAIPEPGSAALVLIGVAGALAARRRRFTKPTDT